ncbi:MAG: O-antigen ligase family protein [Coriobacteriia bacterium]|nr:O-antigen ligase family protein [Coriobacteriia bacterium]MCL2870183.1 O-antigen ligase family protein [Coriobacteriia bacterium]
MGKSKKDVREIREHTREGKIAWWLILALVAVVPIVMANGPLNWMGFNFADGFDGVKIFVLRIGVMAILAAWIWDVVRNGGEIRYHALYILLGVLLVWIVITTITSINPATAFLGKYRRYDGAWAYFLYALLMFLTMQYATSLPRVRQLAQTLSFSSVVVAGYGLLQAIPNPWRSAEGGAIANWDPLTWGVLPFEPLRSFSTFGNPNLLAGFLAFSIFVTLGLLLSEKQPKWRRWYWFVLLLNSAVAITAFSRSLWAAVLVTGIIFVVLVWRQKIKPVKEDYYFAGGLAAVVTAFAAYSLTRADAVTNIWSRIQTIFEFDQGSGLTRTQIWEAALAAIAERPIFGYGLDTFRLIFRHFAPPEYAQAAGFRSVADNAHNFPLQLATGIGIVGAILFFALLFWVAFIAIRRCLKVSEESKADRMLLIGIVCACIAYCVHLFFGLSLPSTSFLLWILMGAVLVPYAKVFKVKKSTWMVPVAVLLSALLLVPVVFSVRLFAADSAYAIPAGIVATGVSNTDAATLQFAKEEAERAVRLNPFNERYYVDYFILFSSYALVQHAQGSPDAPMLIEESRSKAQHLIDMSSWEYDSYLAVATFYLNLGTIFEGEEGRTYTLEAAEFMREKIEQTPTGLALRVRYAEALLVLDDIDAAKDELTFVIEHDTNHTRAAEMLQELKEESP